MAPHPDGARRPRPRIYLSVGSSCNACTEKEPERATILRMNPDGSGREVFATGCATPSG